MADVPGRSHPGDPDVVQLSLAPEQQSVRRARHALQDALERWGLADLADLASVVCSELTTNALLHGAPPVRLVLRRGGGTVRIEVHDGRRSDPVVGRRQLHSTQGRGLAMVEMLASAWGVAATGEGKLVWAEVVDVQEPPSQVTLQAVEELRGLTDPVPERDRGADAPADIGAGRTPHGSVARLAALTHRGAAPVGPEQAELRARVLVDHMQQFVGLLDGEGVLIDVNVPALVGGGLRPEDVLGRHFWECAWWQVSTRTVRRVREAVEAAGRGSEVRYDADVWGGAAGSQLITIDFSCRPVVGADGTVAFMVVEGRDITERKRAEEKLAAAIEQLEVANQRLTELDSLRRQFIANVSHELRTPLTIILSGADSLLQPTPLDVARTVHRMRDAGTVLLKRVNDLLAAAALEHRRELRRSEVDLALLARRVSAQYEGLAAGRGQQLLVAADERCIAQVDPDLIESLLSNLVGNAIKFTPVGGVVRVSVQRWGERTLLQVADNGPGIPAEMRSTVLEAFRQVEGGATRRHEGTGLGLAIAAQVVARHGGDITVAEAPEGGALISVTLPSSAPEEASPVEPDRRPSDAVQADVDALRAELRPAPAVGRGAWTGRPRVLVAEDSVDLGDYLVELLSSRYDVALARDGAQALPLVAEARPDLILTDVMMPGLSGLDLLASTRSDPALASVPVVVLTAKADLQHRMEALRSGAADYILKPFDPSELLVRLDNLLGR